jgi:hypothetical protein
VTEEAFVSKVLFPFILVTKSLYRVEISVLDLYLDAQLSKKMIRGRVLVILL